MNKKVDLVMNLMYNLLMAVLLSAIAEMINAGGIAWPNIAVDTIISYILEMLIVLLFPFAKWGQQTAHAKAEPGTVKFRVICSGVTAIPFAILMSAAMSFISCILMLHLPLIVWIMAWFKIVFLFIAIAWICAYFLIPVFIKLAMKLLHIPVK